MDCILNGVKLPSVNSDNNILFVDSYKEVFFDIYNVEINGKSFIAEFVENTRTGPLVKIKDFTLGENIYHDVTFLLVKEKADVRVHLNESNVTQAVYTPVPKLIYHSPVKTQQLITEKVSKPIDISAQREIQKLKEQALANIEKEKQQLELIKEQTENANKIVESKLEEYKTKLLEYFYSTIDTNVNTFAETASKKLDVVIEELKQINSTNFQEQATQVIEKSKEDLLLFFNQNKANVIEELNNKLSDDLNKISSEYDVKVDAQFKLFGKEYSDVIDVKYKNIQENLNTQTSTLNEKIDKVLESYKSSLLQDYLNTLNDTLEKISQKSSSENIKLTETVTLVNEQKVSELQKLADTQLSTLVESVNKTKEQLENKITSDIDTATKQALGKINETTQSVDKLVEESAKEIKAYFKNVETDINDLKTKLTENVDSHSVKALQEINSYVDNLSENVLQDFKNRNTLLDEKINTLSLFIANANSDFDKLTKELTEEIDSYGKDLLKNIDSYVESIKDKNNETIVKEITTAKQDINDYLAKITVDTIYEKFKEHYGSKFDSILDETFKDASSEALLEKFDFFKSKKTSQKFEQFVAGEWVKKESELIRKVKKLILDFYYSYGSGGGSVAVQYADGGTINGDLNVNGQILSGGQNIFNILSGSGGGGGPSQVPYSVFARSGYSGPTAVIDYFELSAFNSAKYNIQVLSGDQIYASTVYVMGNTSVAKYTEYTVLHTTSNPYINYSVATNGTVLQLTISATPNLYNMIIKGVRLDPILQ